MILVNSVIPLNTVIPVILVKAKAVLTQTLNQVEVRKVKLATNITNFFKGLNIRYNESGYRQFQDSDGSWVYTHRRVAEKKLGNSIRPNQEVHHINKDRTDNRYKNLVVLDRNIHKSLHVSKYSEKKTCFRCGRTNHHSKNCYAKTDLNGNYLYFFILVLFIIP